MPIAATKSKPRPKRSRDPWETRSRILDAAEALVLTRGFSATTVDEVCAGSGVTKGAFFHHFENKDAMFHELLDRFAARNGGPLAGSIDPAGGKRPLERLDALLDAIIRGNESADIKGCLVGMASLELGLADEAFRDRCGTLLGGFRSMVEKLLGEVGDEFPAVSDFNPENLATQLLATLQGAIVVGRATGDANTMRQAIDEFRAGVKARVGCRQQIRKSENET